MNKEEYLEILKEIDWSDSISRRKELRGVLWSRLGPILAYLMSQEYCSSSAHWGIEDGPSYYKDSVYVSVDYHIPRLSREEIGISLTIEDFLDDSYVDRLKEEKRQEELKKFDYTI